MRMLLRRVRRVLRLELEDDEPATELNPGTIRPYRAIFSSPKTYFSRSILIDLVYAGVINLGEPKEPALSSAKGRRAGVRFPIPKKGPSTLPGPFYNPL